MGGVAISGLLVGLLWIICASLTASYSLFYLFIAIYSLFTSPHVPLWARCDQSYNTEQCTTHGDLIDMNRENISWTKMVSMRLLC